MISKNMISDKANDSFCTDLMTATCPHVFRLDYLIWMPLRKTLIRYWLSSMRNDMASQWSGCTTWHTHNDEWVVPGHSQDHGVTTRHLPCCEWPQDTDCFVNEITANRHSYSIYFYSTLYYLLMYLRYSTHCSGTRACSIRFTQCTQSFDSIRAVQSIEWRSCLISAYSLTMPLNSLLWHSCMLNKIHAVHSIIWFNQAVHSIEWHHCL